MYITLDPRLASLQKHLKHANLSVGGEILSTPSVVLHGISGRYSTIFYLILSSPSEVSKMTSSLQAISEMESSKTTIVLLNLTYPDIYIELLDWSLDILHLTTLKELTGFLLSILSEVSSPNMIVLQRSRPSEDPWICFLTSIPGITVVKASAISESYPCISKLLQEYSISSDPATLLSTIPLGSLKLGKALSTKIYKFISSSRSDELI